MVEAVSEVAPILSPRVYGGAWSHEAALTLLREETGIAFDGRCVAALERVLLREQPESSTVPQRIAAASA